MAEQRLFISLWVRPHFRPPTTGNGKWDKRDQATICALQTNHLWNCAYCYAEGRNQGYTPTKTKKKHINKWNWKRSGWRFRPCVGRRKVGLTTTIFFDIPGCSYTPISAVFTWNFRCMWVYDDIIPFLWRKKKPDPGLLLCKSVAKIFRHNVFDNQGGPAHFFVAYKTPRLSATPTLWG